MSTTRTAITTLQAVGNTPAEIARQLGVAPTTVSYHLDRSLKDDGEPPRPVLSLPAAPSAGTALSNAPRPAVFPSTTRHAVALLLADGMPHAEIARRLGLSKSTVSYHARRLGRPLNERCARRYDWAAIQCYYDQGHSVRDCILEFGFSSASWSDAVRRGAIVPRPAATPISQLLVAGTYRGRNNLKVRLLKEGLKAGRCERCGLNQRRGETLSLALHHVNGDRLDNRLQNLELLCPNCHSQTDTYSGRNGHRRSGDSPRVG